MLEKISLGIFYPGTSVIHRLQARTKLLMIFWLIGTLLIANHRQWHFISYIVALGLMFVGLLASGIALRDFGKRLWFLVLIVFSSLFISIFGASSDSPVIWSLGPWRPSYASLSQDVLWLGTVVLAFFVLTLLPPLRGWCQRHFWLRFIRRLALLAVLGSLLFFWLTNGFAASRPMSVGPLIITQQGAWLTIVTFVAFCVLFISSTLLTMTTRPVALIEGLTLLLSPLRRLKLPVDDFALMLLLSLRFIPTLLEEADQLMKAQVARGADITHGTARERFQSLAMFFVPLVQGVLRRASELATALDARGYQSDGPRTLLYEQPLSRLDYLALSLVILVTTIPLFL
ncbi:energy-coupling factor transporter transmembrane component T family protein [Dictyobacter formicarum]|uniref:Energy-coupling factor transporter transmembrane protein EcfT n=1 Tax=Dictyobacter formicarum TaxID=2778368 RepID=A0ABQ3VF60_9CHLR|nr:energy-coupling factor transporter transmembrane component T [Dictyobacter formicarum]GHO84807.1 hypothetical protein KSZ_28130 [Dictyobacter formicarum]